MVQPLKSMINIYVFMRFHFFDFFAILMTSGTSWDLIFDTFGGLETPFWWFLDVLDMHWNFIDFLDHPKPTEHGWWKVNCSSRGTVYQYQHQIADLQDIRLQIPHLLMEYWKELRIECWKVFPRSLVGPGKQGAADIWCINVYHMFFSGTYTFLDSRDGVKDLFWLESVSRMTLFLDPSPDLSFDSLKHRSLF